MPNKPARPTSTLDRDARQNEIKAIQSRIRYLAAKLPAAQGGAPTAQVLFLDSLRSARRAQKLTQSQLAAKVGVSQVTIARMETGKVSPSLDTVFQIAGTLGLNISIS